jgi:hypothetical protein
MKKFSQIAAQIHEHISNCARVPAGIVHIAEDHLHVLARATSVLHKKDVPNKKRPAQHP